MLQLLSVLHLEKLANWWDEQASTSREALEALVETHPNWFAITVAGTTDTAMHLGAGFVDLLRVGEGVKEGSVKGYVQDGLRVLTLAGPVMKLGRNALTLLTKDPLPTEGICAWVSSTQALRQTGTKHFVTVADLMKAEGFSGVVPEGVPWAPESMANMVEVVKKFGAQTQVLGEPQTWAELETLVRTHRDGAVLFGVQFYSPIEKMTVGHALLAVRNSFGGIRIIDRTGISASNVVELEKAVLSRFGSTYTNISQAVPARHAVLVKNAAVVVGQTMASILALEVRTVMLVDRATADKEIERLKAVH